MSILKFGENLSLAETDFISSDSIKSDQKLHDRFVKLAKDIKRIAPKADDFLYFTAIMMHAAEKALLDDNGNLRKDTNGNNISAKWKIDPKTGSWKWVCSDSSILPYKNANGDIFPEAELKLAYKKWVGKPLCKDHKSDTVDGMRGIIIDTYWDDKHKRIISLCALDKINDPDLARHVSTRVANCVSMGVAVARSICMECGNVATVESEYCNHVRGKTAYGEINVGLNPIELSIVMNGADRKAKVLEVLAAAQEIENKVSNLSDLDMQDIYNKYTKLEAKVNELEKEILTARNNNNFAFKRTASFERNEDESYLKLIKHKVSNLQNTLTSIENKISTEDRMGNIRKGYWQGTEEPKPGQKQYEAEEADSIRNTQDSHMKLPLTDLSPAASSEIPKQDLEIKLKHSRASVEERRAIRAAIVEKTQKSIKASTKTAYPQGTEENKKYPIDPLAEKARKEDTQMNTTDTGKTDGLFPGDKEIKEKHSRASLKARLIKANNASDNRWEVVDKGTNKVVFSATFSELAGKKPIMYKPLYEKDFAKHIMSTIRTVGLNKAEKMFKSAQEAPELATAPAPAVAPVPAPELAPEPEPLSETPPGDVSLEGKDEGNILAGINAVVEGLNGVEEVLRESLPSIEEALGAMTEEKESFEGVEESAPEETVETALEELGKQEEPTVASMNKVRVKINASLIEDFKKVAKMIKVSMEEIQLLKGLVKNSSDNTVVMNLAQDALLDAKKTIKEAETLKLAFVKYAKTVDIIQKRAQMESFEKPELIEDKLLLEDEEVPIDQMVGPEETSPEELELDLTLPEVEDIELDFGKSAEERKNDRHKIAASAVGKQTFSDMINKAHPKGGTKLEGLQSPESYVEDIEEVSNKMREVVSREAKVKKAAEDLDAHIKAGRVTSDVDKLVRHGLDKDVVSYWKKYYGQVEGGAEFAADLLKEYNSTASKEKKAKEEEDKKTKMLKAFDLAYQMASTGLIPNSQVSIRKEAEKIISFNDESYETVKRVVQHHERKAKKTASAAIQVGVALDNNESIEEDNFFSKIQRIW